MLRKFPDKHCDTAGSQVLIMNIISCTVPLCVQDEQTNITCTQHGVIPGKVPSTVVLAAAIHIMFIVRVKKGFPVWDAYTCGIAL